LQTVFYLAKRYKLYFKNTIKILQTEVFTRESSYCFQRVLAIAILPVCPSVCPSVRHTDGQKRCKLGSPNFHRRLPGKL